MTVRALPATPPIKYRIRYFTCPTTGSTNSPNAIRTIILLIRCAIPICRNIQEASLQNSPSRIRCVTAAPILTKTPVSSLPPRISQMRKSTTFAATSASVTGHFLKNSRSLISSPYVLCTHRQDSTGHNTVWSLLYILPDHAEQAYDRNRCLPPEE